MHRMIEITIQPEHTDSLINELEHLEGVLGLSVQRGASVKPPGDVVTAQVLNRGSDDVLRRVQEAQARGVRASVATGMLASIIDKEHWRQIKDDVDEELWEEMETGLRHYSHVTSNFLLLMALGGAIAAAGHVWDPVFKVIAWVAASIIAPGFEPLNKIPMGLVMRNWDVVRRGFYSTASGYGVLIVGAGTMFLVLSWAGEASAQDLVGNAEVQHLVAITWKSALVSGCAALAGITITASYRETFIAGPLIALALIPTAAAVGAGAAALRPALVMAALLRLGLDMLLIVVLSALFILWKQASVHRREPII
jgi:uncharacterized membrane protein